MIYTGTLCFSRVAVFRVCLHSQTRTRWCGTDCRSCKTSPVQQQQSCYVKADYNAAGSVAESSCILVSHLNLRSQKQFGQPGGCQPTATAVAQGSHSAHGVWQLATRTTLIQIVPVCMLTQSAEALTIDAAEKNAFAVFQSASPAGNNGAAEKPIWCAAHP